MTRSEFLQLIESKIVILDGATGSNLQERGMPVGVCPEKWILEHKEVLIELQREYIEAGSDIIYVPTFTSNRIKLAEYGLGDQIESINKELVKLSKQAIALVREKGIDKRIYIAGDLTMTGEQLYPVGTLTFEELVDVYKEQIRYMILEGVDLFVVETMMSLQECRAAVLAIKETCNLPIMVTLTFEGELRTLYGTDPATAIVVMESMGVDGVGVNCSTGPEKMCEVVSIMKKYGTVPIIAKPNAGLPHLQDGVTVYDMEAPDFAIGIKKLVEAGASIVGGCCGTTPKHIQKLNNILDCMSLPIINKNKVATLTTERRTVEIKLDGPFMVVGERINPTGKKALQKELRAGEIDLVTQMAREQVENGADILDINMGMNGIDEKEMMLQVINELAPRVNVPLCIDSSDIDVLEAALRIYPGRALINSVSLEDEKMERLLPIIKKYGAMFILLPLSSKGMPKDINEKKEIIQTIVTEAYSLGIMKKDIIVDGLVNTVGANKQAATEALATIRYCKQELGLATICGLSNISFGLPERSFINSTFLAFAMKEGLTMAIANPSQELLVNTAFAADLLLNKEDSDIRYINRVTSHPSTFISEKKEKQSEKVDKGADKINPPVYEDVVKGNKKNIVDTVKKVLQEGVSAGEVLDNMLIPAINQVGDLFDKQIYFLPQLISSAEAMETAIVYLEPLLHKGEDSKKLGTVVIATVDGDIHDIGKNLVVLMLKNYGIEVIDLGKDVACELIVEKAKEVNADIIGLSALMTTTMIRMKTVVEMVKEQGLKAKVMIGGAVITESYAKEIGADGYSKDAQDAVKVAKRLLEL
jgi:5-methyltetrahydrofolate--homocysteine methyltransferase